MRVRSVGRSLRRSLVALWARRERKEEGRRREEKPDQFSARRVDGDGMSRDEGTHLRRRHERHVDESSVRNEILFLSRQDGDLEGVLLSDEVGIGESQGVSSLVRFRFIQKRQDR